MSSRVARQGSAVMVCGLVFGMGVSSASAQCNWNKLIPDDGEGSDLFGTSVAISGEYAIVGASGVDAGPDNVGAAYIFQRDGTDWVQQNPPLTADVRERDDKFGGSVSISGDYAIVGVQYDDDDGLTSGSAFIFRREVDTWVREKLTASDAAAFDNYGVSVAIDGEYAVVGAYADDDNSENESGSVYVYKRTGTTWDLDQKLHAGDPDWGDFFGIAVAISGDYLVVGAEGDNSVSRYSNSGAAYVFVRQSGTWVQHDKLTPSDPAAYAYFGHSVSIDGDVVVVGADRDANACAVRGADACGSADVFRRFGSSWPWEQRLTPDDPSGVKKFGSSIAVFGNRIVVGAPHDGHAGTGSGAAYLFVKDGSDPWVQCKRTARDSATGDKYGASVALDGAYVLIGAPGDNVRSLAVKSGSAYVAPDCNGNCVRDECDTDPTDPDGDGQVSLDCNSNGVIDECEEDCQPNGIPDDCDLIDGTSDDCNTNGVPDECDLIDGTSDDCNTNEIPDECDIGCPGCPAPTPQTSPDADGNGIPDECDCPEGEVVFVDPDADSEDGIIDARQPHPPDDPNDLQGIEAIVVSGPPGAEKLTCWTSCETGNSDPSLDITGVVDNGGGMFTVNLNRPIAAGEVATITYTGLGRAAYRGMFTSHPANVDGDGESGQADIGALVDCCLNGGCVPTPMYSCDVDHSNAVTATDILRVIDLLNGADGYDRWQDTPLPDCGVCCP